MRGRQRRVVPAPDRRTSPIRPSGFEAGCEPVRPSGLSRGIAGGALVAGFSVEGREAVALKLKEIIPWGRSFEEYRLMFALSDAE
jgi:hypothetical protein